MTNDPDQPIWMDTSDAATHAQRHPVTVRRALEAGELHGSQRAVRGRWRIHRDCLDAWVLGVPCPHGHVSQKSA